MRKSPAAIASELTDVLRRESEDVITIPWDQFYRFVERDRIKESFQKNLEKALREKSLLISYGSAVVLVAKDFRFSELDLFNEK